MEKNKKDIEEKIKPVGVSLVENLWGESWTYIKTVVDIVREPILILDKDLRVVEANEPFYRTFQVEKKDTENKIVYDLGNGQWDIPALKKLLEDILPKNTFFRGFEVSHEFPFIGPKVMILNARQIHFNGDSTFEPIILLAMEDVTEMMAVAEKLANHANQLQASILDRTEKVEINMEKLERQMADIRKMSQKN